MEGRARQLLELVILIRLSFRISVVYMIENIPKRTRGYVSTLISYSPNVILLGILAFFFQQWDRLALAIAFLTVPAIVMLA